MSKNNRILAAALTAALVAPLVPAAICAAQPNCAAAPPAGTSCNIDNFRTGTGAVGPISTGSTSVNQSGAGIAGGTRTVNIATTPPVNEFSQSTLVQVKRSSTASVPSALIWSSGYKNDASIQVVYGYPNLLNLNLTPYDRFRVTFDGLQQGLNWQMGVSTNSILGSCAFNTDPSATSFTVDFPFSQFGAPIDWSDVTEVFLEFQNAGSIGAPNMALTGVEAILGSAYPPATYTCAAPAQ